MCSCLFEFFFYWDTLVAKRHNITDFTHNVSVWKSWHCVEPCKILPMFVCCSLMYVTLGRWSTCPTPPPLWLVGWYKMTLMSSDLYSQLNIQFREHCKVDAHHLIMLLKQNSAFPLTTMTATTTHSCLKWTHGLTCIKCLWYLVISPLATISHGWNVYIYILHVHELNVDEMLIHFR